jgi:hypothetical protein
MGAIAALSGCADYYGPAYGYGSYYGSPYYGHSYYGAPYYGRSYYGAPAPYYAGPSYGYPAYGYGYGSSVVVDIRDRPYYTHGPGYYVGRTYYVWKPGRWAIRNGHRVWIRGHYVVRNA